MQKHARATRAELLFPLEADLEPRSSTPEPKAKGPTFVDVFAGCGGLSLGLKRAGWHGLFAIEKDTFAFDTLRANFLTEKSDLRYDWPSWLEQKPWGVEDVISTHGEQLKALRGKVDLLAGGPPCQGFSSAGRRRASDPRNAMLDQYIKLVELIEPRILLIENVVGITLDFQSAEGADHGKNFAHILRERLKDHYHLSDKVLQASDFGIPQRRRRFILVGIRKVKGLKKPPSPLINLDAARDAVLKKHKLPRKCSARSAISDLEVARNGTVPCPDSEGFEAISFKGTRTRFQRAMHAGSRGMPSDTRLANHTDEIVKRFGKIIAICRKEERSTRQLSTEHREKFGLQKKATRVLDPEQPAPTITSMPDDLIHYSEPRTLTVRENARLQTFPDWFVFKGKYTTGGHLRRIQVPRFTQVANAVPPLLAEIVGVRLRERARD